MGAPCVSEDVLPVSLFSEDSFGASWDALSRASKAPLAVSAEAAAGSSAASSVSAISSDAGAAVSAVVLKDSMGRFCTSTTMAKHAARGSTAFSQGAFRFRWGAASARMTADSRAAETGKIEFRFALYELFLSWFGGD